MIDNQANVSGMDHKFRVCALNTTTAESRCFVGEQARKP